MERCRSASIQALIHQNLITSGDMLATLLPQLTSALLSASFNDPRLQDLYAAIYQAFRRRRSLLLLNLEKQVQLEELPWIQAIEPLRSQMLNVQDQSRKGLEEIAVLTLNSFPQAIIPNKLLQEMKALADGARLDIPLLKEVAADIFMGKFSDKFLEAAKRAGTLLGGTLYTTYYGIDYPAVEAMNPGPDHPFLQLFRSHATDENAFANFCAKRANVDLGGWAPATNGMIIEQQQIVTTQNLAVLFDELGLTDRLREDLPGMVRKCFEWICRKLQTRARDWHSRMVAIKNSAYAWRQMLFFLSCMGDGDVDLFMRWAEVHLAKQSEAFQLRFRPAINGLIAAVAGRAFEDESRIRHFFGWSKEHHWLLREGPEHSRMA